MIARARREPPGSRPLGKPTGWRFYCRTPDIAAADDEVSKSGGTVHHGPIEVPSGDRVIFAGDAHGVLFGAWVLASKESRDEQDGDLPLVWSRPGA